MWFLLYVVSVCTMVGLNMTADTVEMKEPFIENFTASTHVDLEWRTENAETMVNAKMKARQPVGKKYYVEVWSGYRMAARW